MKKNSIIHLIFPLLLCLLTSCNKGHTYVDVNKPQNEVAKENQDTTDVVNPDKSYKKANSFKYTIKDVDNLNDWISLKSTGNQKILVVPVQLKDGPVWTQKMLENLYTVFFSENGEGTNWESVHSFFYKSSYEQLNLMGEVYCNPLKVNSYSIYTFAKSYRKNLVNPTYEIAKQFYDNIDSEYLQKFDQDNDGFVDSIVFCYSHKYNQDAYWAWVDYNTNFKANKNKPNINTHMWVSYDFMNDTKYSYYPDGLDAHTYIHETGHLLGLEDYYNYDYSWNAAGELDMQSYNVGDHNIYSKLALGWIKPYIVEGSCTIKIRTSSKYPDAILFKNPGSNINSLFDEYLIMEYYTPTNLNAQDAQYSYTGRDKMYSDSGIRLYHVDARLVKNPKKTIDWYGNITTTNDGYTKFLSQGTAIGASNSPITWSNLPEAEALKYYYLHLLDEGHNNTIGNGHLEYNSTLWHAGSSTKTYYTEHEYSYQTDAYFNDNTKMKIFAEIMSINGEEATIKFTTK